MNVAPDISAHIVEWMLESQLYQFAAHGLHMLTETFFRHETSIAAKKAWSGVGGDADSGTFGLFIVDGVLLE